MSDKTQHQFMIKTHIKLVTEGNLLNYIKTAYENPTAIIKGSETRCVPVLVTSIQRYVEDPARELRHLSDWKRSKVTSLQVRNLVYRNPLNHY